MPMMLLRKRKERLELSCPFFANVLPSSLYRQAWYRDKPTRRREILSKPGECMNYSLNRETLVCLMALVMVTKAVWQPARTHKQKQHNLGQDGASSGGYAMLSMIMERYAFLQSLYKLCLGQQTLTLTLTLIFLIYCVAWPWDLWGVLTKAFWQSWKLWEDASTLYSIIFPSE